MLHGGMRQLKAGESPVELILMMELTLVLKLGTDDKCPIKPNHHRC
jgi:hypothetical protein